jgi:hypothetical protein
MNHWCNQNLIQQIQGSDGEDPPLLSTPASDEAFLVGCDLCLWEASSCHAVTLRMDQHVEPLERNLHIGQLESIGIMPLGILLFPMQK